MSKKSLNDYLNQKVPAPVDDPLMNPVATPPRPETDLSEFEEIEVNLSQADAGGLGDKLSSMFPGVEQNLTRELDEMEAGEMDGNHDPDEESAFNEEYDDGTMEFDLDFDVDMLIDLFDDGRKIGHSFLYDKLFDVRDAQEIYDYFVLKRDLKDWQHQMKCDLHEFLKVHRENRSAYMEAVAYSEKTRKNAARYLRHVAPTIKGKKRWPKWLVPLIIFGLPELVLGAKLFMMKKETPVLNLDFVKRAIEEEKLQKKAA